MPLDSNTQYYQMGDNAGAQPSSPSVLGIDPSLDLQSAGAQAAPAAGQGLASLVQLIQRLAAPQGQQPMVPRVPTTQPSLIDPGMSAGPQDALSLAPFDAPTPPTASPLAALSAMSTGGQQAPAPVTMPAMPKHNNTVLQAIGALSALAGGPGGRIASQVIANQKAGDTDRYNQQVQAYQIQERGQQQQADNTGQLTDSLAKLDPASQEARVRSLMQSPGILSAYGYTPASAQAQFFDKDGKLQPVSAADKPANAATLARAQTAARATMSHMTTEGQQSYHDSFAKDPDGWTQQTGLPYEGFQPSATARDTTQAGTLAERIKNDAAGNSIKQSDAQVKEFASLTDMTAKSQGTIKAFYAQDPAQFEAKYGVPYAAWTPGMTQKDATALLGVQNRETDAQRTDATHLKIAKLNTATRIGIDNENNRVAMRGQDLRAQMEGKQINARVSMFKQRYGDANGGAAEKQYQSLLKDRMQMQKRMTALSAPQKDAFGEPTLSLRDQGRIDADGNHIPNPPETAAYKEYMYLLQQDEALKAQMDRMGSPAVSAATAQVAPAPVTVSGNNLSRLAPNAPPLPSFPAYTSRSGRSVNSLSLPGFSSPAPRASASAPRASAAPESAARLTPTQIHGMTTSQLLQRLATRLKGR